MRTLVLGVLLGSAVAQASPRPPASQEVPVDRGAHDQPPVASPVPPARADVVVDELPRACRALGVETQASGRNRALSARIALANCLVDQRLRELILCDCEQSAIEVEAASAPSLVMLDDVAYAGDPTLQILARHALGELLTSLATRLLATIPPAIDPSPAARTLRDTRAQMLAQRLQPWRDRARAAYRDVDQIARANPSLLGNPAVASAVRTSRARLSEDEIARR